MLAEASGPDQRAAKKMRPGHCTKKNHPGSPEVTFLVTDTSFAQSHPTLLDLYLVFPRNFRMILLPHTNTVNLLEPYCGTITEPGLPVLLQTYCCHLEMATSLEADAFLTRMVDRRGWPKLILSDNGNNYVGAAGAIKELAKTWIKRQLKD